MTATVDQHSRTTPERPEASYTLDFTPPRPLGLFDQVTLWGNLGISLFGPVTGAFVAATTGSIASGLLATFVGCLLGALVLGGSAVFGASTGAPAMACMRGLFGRRGSYVPTALNIAQNVGWATMEIILIAEAAAAVVGETWRPVFAVGAGFVATVMAVRPLGSVRTLRRYMVWAVLAASLYLYVAVLREPMPGFTEGGFSGFWPSVDLAVAVVVSFAPLAADYSRHSRTPAAAFGGAALGYGTAALAYISLGVLAVYALGTDGEHVVTALVALPAGALALLVLLVDEVDEAFANIYSTTMSTQNIAPRVDRRGVSVAIGALATVLALTIDLRGYESFLYLLGSVFVPLFAVAIVDFLVVRRGRWDLSPSSRLRVRPVLGWLAGFVAYQVVNPGTVPGWSDAWTALRDAAGLTPPAWLGASVASLAVAVLATLVLALPTLVRQRRRV
ncbi:MAG: purine-cytosine permease family protein [Actinomycetes bacterium]